MTIVIGLHGPIGSGKDTLGRGLAFELGGVKLFKFARALYEMAAVLDPVFAQNMAHEDKEAPLLGLAKMGTRRNFLEKLGTEFGRGTIHPQLWTNTLANDIRRADSPIAVITDVRFAEEAEWVRKRGVLVHLVPDWTTIGADSEHSSNKALPHGDMDIILPLRKGNIFEGVEALRRIVKAIDCDQ